MGSYLNSSSLPRHLSMVLLDFQLKIRPTPLARQRRVHAPLFRWRMEEQWAPYDSPNPSLASHTLAEGRVTHLLFLFKTNRSSGHSITTVARLKSLQHHQQCSSRNKHKQYRGGSKKIVIGMDGSMNEGMYCMHLSKQTQNSKQQLSPDTSLFLSP